MSVGVGSKYYSGFNPLNPGSCVLWMDAAQETAANGAFINTTTDKSSNAYPITAVTNNTVTLTRPGLNGLPIFNLGANRMLISNFVWRTKFTAVLVTKNAVGDFILAHRSGGAYRNYIFGYNYDFLYVNAGDQYLDSVAAQGTSVTGTDWTIWIVQYNNVANPQWRLNGTVRSTTRTGGVTQGDTTNTAALYFNGVETSSQSSCQIAEILIYNDFLSTAQCEDIEGYLATKWGLRSLLPGPPSTTYVTNPASIPNCVAWLDSADSATVIRTGSTVTQWNDKTSNAYNATPSATPSYSTTAFNTSYPGVTMTSGFFTLNIPANTFSNGISAISVFRPDANTVQYWMARPAIGAIPRPIDSYTNSTQNRRLIGNGTQYWEITLSAGYSYRTQSNTIYYFEANSGSTFSWVEFVNGVQQSMAGTLFTSGTPSYSDATSTTLRLHLTGIHCEHIIFNGRLTRETRRQLEAYLANKWGLLSIYSWTNAHRYLRAIPVTRPFLPLDISGCTLWVDGSDPNAMTLSGSNIATIQDKSGINTLTVSATGPVYESNARNGLGRIRFDGSNFIRGASASLPLATRAVFIVAEQNPNTAVGGNADGILSIGGGASIADWSNRSAIVYAGRASNASQNSSFSAVANNFDYAANVGIYSNAAPFGIYTDSFSVSSGSLFVNGRLIVTDTVTSGAGPLTATGFIMGARLSLSTTPSSYYNGYIYEVLFYSNALTTIQRQQVESYLARKWGLLSTLSSVTVSSFTPTQIPSCALWLDAADPATLTLSGSNITVWADKSGNARDVSASGTITNTGNINGLTAALWSSAGPYFRGNASNTGNSVTVFSVFNLNQASSPTSNTRVISLGTTGVQDYTSTSHFLPIYKSSGSSNIDAYRNNALLPGITNTVNVPVLITSLVNGTSHVMYANGVASPNLPNATSGNFNYSNHYIGANPVLTDTTSFFVGTIGEVIIYNTALVDTSRQQVERYLANKWKLSAGGLLANSPFIRNTPMTTSFNPRQISNCVFWIDAADPSTITSNASSVVTQVGDKSGNGRTLTNAMTSTGFTWNITKMNGSYPSFYYNSTQNVTLGSNSTISLTQPATMFIVLQPVGTASFQGVVDGTDGTNRWYSFIFFPTTTTPNYRIFAGATLTETTNMVTATPTVYSQYFNTTSSIIYRNGTSNASGTAGVLNCTGITVGSRFTQNTETFQGHIAEVLYYQRLLTTQERQQVEGYLAWKWGLSNNLASNHPYRRISPV